MFLLKPYIKAEPLVVKTVHLWLLHPKAVNSFTCPAEFTLGSLRWLASKHRLPSLVRNWTSTQLLFSASYFYNVDFYTFGVHDSSEPGIFPKMMEDAFSLAKINPFKPQEIILILFNWMQALLIFFRYYHQDYACVKIYSQTLKPCQGCLCHYYRESMFSSNMTLEILIQSSSQAMQPYNSLLHPF